MAYVLEMCFDNSHRLSRKSYLFEYRGVRFKLVQDNPRRWADHLLSIVPAYDSPAADLAFSAGCEFVSALGWEHQARVAVWETGGAGWPDSSSLREAQPTFRTFPRNPFGGNVIGYHLSRLPHIETDEQRIALALLREAKASNNDYLSFLFFWHVLDVGGGRPENYIDRVFRRHRARLRVQDSEINRLPIGTRSLGQYLLDDCRHAIAHIRRYPGKRKLSLDDRSERMRLTISARVMEAFAQDYIREALGLRKHQYLVRRKRGDVPVFVPEHMLRYGFRQAYPRPRLRNIWGSRRPRGKRTS